MIFKTYKRIFWIISLVLICGGVFVYYYFSDSSTLEQKENIKSNIELINTSGEIIDQSIEINRANDLPLSINNANENNTNIIIEQIVDVPPEIFVTHKKIPEAVKAVYVSGWVAGSTKLMNNIINLIDRTELNAIVIDIKDSTGRVSFMTDNPLLNKIGSSEKRISNIKELTNRLHEKNIYIIGRISVFQDPYLTKVKPEWAITRKSDGGIWKDRKGLSFLDPTKKEVHDYTITLAKESYELGFDEINFDYIRYPSDGDISDINYRLTEGKTRADNMENFFKYLSAELKKPDADGNPSEIIISADLFGLTTEGQDDMGIGQVWERTIPYFDFVCPMVYPSHYPAGYMGYAKPAQYPYEVINKALKGAVLKNNAMGADISKIRPWIQDFDLGAVYTKDMIRKEIQAVYDNNLNSWMLWDPANKYTAEALLLENEN